MHFYYLLLLFFFEQNFTEFRSNVNYFIFTKIRYISYRNITRTRIYLKFYVNE
jgi:hypothetical protein